MDLKLDATGDIAIEDGDLVLLRGVESVAQDISVRLKWILGEWHMDTRLGMPYIQKLLGKKPNLPAIREIFRKAIMSAAGMKELLNYVLTYDGPTRALTVRFDGVSEEGPFVYDKELII